MKTGRGRGRPRVGKKDGESAKTKPQTNDLDGTIHPDGQEFPTAPQFNLSRDVLDREEIPPINAENIPLELQVLICNSNVSNLLMLDVSMQVFLDTMRDQYLEFIKLLKHTKCVEMMKRHIEMERERKNALSLQVAQLGEQVFLSVIDCLWRVVFTVLVK